jgi:FAD binding domain-containing protein/berberine-like enzyme
MATGNGLRRDVESLQSELAGTALLPDDDGYDVARQAWNLGFTQQPAVVALPESAEDVSAVVDFARDAGLRVAVQAAGHAASALGDVGEDTVLLRTVRMLGADLDVEGRRARVAPGAQWMHVNEPASEHGLAGLSGSSREVGVVGYTLGGGLGWLGRLHGLACNSVTAVELVTADGGQVRADRDGEPDLFWALRGGGGNFGAVTALEFELHPVPELYAGMMLWPWESASEVLHRWREWVEAVPDELTSVGRLVQLPPLPDVPEPLRGRSFVGVEAAYLGGEEEGARLVEPFRELSPEMDTFAPAPPAALGVLHMDPEDPVPFAGGDRMLAELPPEAIDALIEAAGPGSGSPLLSVEVRHLGGALADAKPDSGALAALDGDFLMFGVGMTMDEAAAEACESQLSMLREGLAPWDAGRCYLNFVEQPVDTREAFPDDVYERLQRVKASYDPDDLFRANHRVPAGVAG